MGMLRLILAISVVTAHTGPVFGTQLVGGGTAVQAFFIISGFYMALILNEKYTQPSSYPLFITNRFLRIFPLYLLCLALSVALEYAVFATSEGSLATRYGLGNTFFQLSDALSDMDFGAVSILVISGLTLIIRSTMTFIGIDLAGGGLVFFQPASDAVLALSQVQFIPQAWSLEHELLFYLMAPLFVRRGWPVIGALFVASIALRLGIQRSLAATAPELSDLVSYFFFPSQLVFFMGGVVAYKIYARYQNLIPPLAGYVVIGAMVAFTYFFFELPAAASIKTKLYYLGFVAGLPLIFAATRRNKLDNWIGELSYPVYICHVMVITVLVWVGTTPERVPLYSVFGALAVAVVLIFLIANRIEALRQSRVARAQVAQGGEAP